MLKRTLLTTLLLASPALATKTQFFSAGTKAEFEAGTLDKLVATNFGELRLSNDVKQLIADSGDYASVDALVEAPDGTLYAGTTASGKLLVIRDGKAIVLANFGGAASVAALVFTSTGDLLICVSGEEATLHVLRKGAKSPEKFATISNAQYLWGIAVAADGKIYVATGPEGLLVELSADGKSQRVVFDSDEDNLRCVAILNDMLFVGTDPNGLILKIDRGTGKAFVIYDAAETEISALLVDTRGGQIYAATSQLVEAPPVEADAEPKSSAGRPHGSDAATHITHEPGEEPKPKPDEDAAALKPNAAPEPAAGTGDAGAPATQHVATITPAGPLPEHPPTTVPDGEVAANGNAVYRIDPQGFVSEVFRDSAMVFGLARKDDRLYIATGPKGTLYQLDLASEEHVAIAKTRAKQLTSILATQDGRLLLGSGGASGAAVSEVSAKLAASGTVTSKVLDASQISQFGKLQVTGSVPADTSITVATRSGNVGDEKSPLWSDWSAPVPAARFTDVKTPTARYVQYRVTLAGNGTGTPALDEVRLAYQQPNVAPRIDSITVAGATPAAGVNANAANNAAETDGSATSASAVRTIEWSSTEPNGDDLQFTLYYRSNVNSPWIVLAKELTGTSYSWDTHRVPDGRYEVKVEASDALANTPGSGKTASRVADPISVDNTPPVIGDIKVERSQGKVNIALRAADKGSVVSALEYLTDDSEHWQTVQPSDMLDDSPDEQYVIVLPDPGAATKVVSLRCRDESGNTAHESVTIRPESK